MKLADLKRAGQDFEFYPTTDEIIRALKADLETQRYLHRRDSILDIGAGNGKVLAAVPVGKKFAIEKSPMLASQLPEGVLFVGGDFLEQTLFDKEVDITFSNPPYSVYSEWTRKILAESCSSLIYLVIPRRWKGDPAIQAAIGDRQASAEVIGSFDFLESEDRQARAKVDLIRIKTQEKHCDRFARFVEEQFPPPPTADEEVVFAKERREIASGEDYLERLVACYDSEMTRTRETYLAVLKLDWQILKGLEINAESLAKILQGKIRTLKTTYWQEVFTRFEAINERFTEKNRRAFLQTLLSNMHVDFTVENVRAVAMWVLKNAHRYIDRQLVEVWERMVSICNVTLYKSNQRTFGDNDWRFRDAFHQGEAGPLQLDLRIVAHYCGGIHNESFSWSRHNGLNDRAHEFLNDLRVVAINLGYEEPTRLEDFEEWTSGQAREFIATTKATGERAVIARVKAFKNQNIHIQFSRRFLTSLNVEYGKIKGWLLTGEQAAEELNEPMAQSIFDERPRLAIQDFLQLQAPR